MKCFSLCNKFIMFIIERISGLSLFLLTFFVFKHNIIQCTLLLCKTAYKLKCINAIPAPYPRDKAYYGPGTVRVQTGYGAGPGRDLFQEIGPHGSETIYQNSRL